MKGKLAELPIEWMDSRFLRTPFRPRTNDESNQQEISLEISSRVLSPVKLSTTYDKSR